MAKQMPVPLSAEPKVDQIVEHEGRTYRTVKEGLAYILIPPNAKTSQDPKKAVKDGDALQNQAQNVFYNPIQQFNRDLSVLAIKAFGEDFCRKQSSRRQQQKQKNDGRTERRKGRKVGRNDLKRKSEVEEEHKVVKMRRLEDGRVVDENEHESRSEGVVPEKSGIHEKETQNDGEGKREENEGDGVVAAPGGDEATHSAAAQLIQQAQAKENGASNHQPEPEPWKPRFRILDALSATGLRALRYAQEIPFATAIVANDMDKGATKSIATNVEHNRLSDKITANTGNAIGHMYHMAFPPTESHGPSHASGKYDVIDLDPYGTAAPFIDAALQALHDGGLLCVTCTDSGVFASCGYSEKTFSLYGGMPAKGAHSHETGLRLILNSIAMAAAKIGLAIEPLLSLSIDFYARVFVRVRKSPADVKFLAGKTMIMYECDYGCGAWTPQFIGRNTTQQGKKPDTTFVKHSISQAPNVDRLCEHCGSKMHIAGPMWAGPLHNATFVEKVLDDLKTADSTVYVTKPRLEGMLDTALEELTVNDSPAVTTDSDDMVPKVPADTVDHSPYFFIPSVMSKVLHCQAPPEAALKGALKHAGYRVARSHCKPGSIKSDAPWSAIWRIMREWVRQKAPIKEGALKETSAGWRILNGGDGRNEKADVNSGPKVELGNGDSDGTGAGPTAPSSKDSSPEVVTEEGASLTKTRPRPKDPSRMKVVFDEALGRDKPDRRKLVRYQMNPRENWGPMSRAKGSG